MSLCSIRALVALCRFAPYALWSRYVALLHTRFGRAIARWAIRALVALLPVGQYALWSRYVALLHTRSWRGYVLTGVVRIRRAWPLPLPPSPLGRGN